MKVDVYNEKSRKFKTTIRNSVELFRDHPKFHYHEIYNYGKRDYLLKPAHNILTINRYSII